MIGGALGDCVISSIPFMMAGSIGLGCSGLWVPLFFFFNSQAWLSLFLGVSICHSIDFRRKLIFLFQSQDDMWHEKNKVSRPL
jgi:hypothetical protein